MSPAVEMIDCSGGYGRMLARACALRWLVANGRRDADKMSKANLEQSKCKDCSDGEDRVDAGAHKGKAQAFHREDAPVSAAPASPALVQVRKRAAVSPDVAERHAVSRDVTPAPASSLELVTPVEAEVVPTPQHRRTFHQIEKRIEAEERGSMAKDFESRICACGCGKSFKPTGSRQMFYSTEHKAAAKKARSGPKSPGTKLARVVPAAPPSRTTHDARRTTHDAAPTSKAPFVCRIRAVEIECSSVEDLAVLLDRFGS